MWNNRGLFQFSLFYQIKSRLLDLFEGGESERMGVCTIKLFGTFLRKKLFVNINFEAS